MKKISVIHFYSGTRPLVREHINTLLTNCNDLVDIRFASSISQLKQMIADGAPDILHLHGCWINTAASAARICAKKGSRIVITPHGDLEPWIMKHHRFSEKIPKMMLWQSNLIRHAYAMIAQGKMESKCLQKIRINKRIEIIRNSVITSLTTPLQMAEETAKLYRKVMDSNPLQLMDKEMCQVFTILLKAGITGDIRWLTPEQQHLPTQIDNSAWRPILIYAYHEGVFGIICKAIEMLQLNVPDVDPASIPCFLPANYQSPKAIWEIIGNRGADNNIYITNIIRQTQKETHNNNLSIKRLCEIDNELRTREYDENWLREHLQTKHLYAFTASLMQTLCEQTLLEEGFMLMKPASGRKNRKINNTIDKHLKI